MAIEKIELSDAIQSLATQSTVDSLVGSLSGEAANISAANLATVVAGKEPLNIVLDGVFVVYFTKFNNDRVAACLTDWPKLQNDGEVASGVLIIQGGKSLIVALNTVSLPWSSAAVRASTTMISARKDAFADFDGYTRTYEQVTHEECASVGYAPGYCAAYSALNANGAGLQQGAWWLPSVGELMLIHANVKKINYALSMITGATQIPLTDHWTSSERNESAVWTCRLSSTFLYPWTTKASYTYYVRPVCL